MLSTVPRWLKLVLKLIIAVALITWVILSADVFTIAERMRQADHMWIAVALVLLFVRHPLAALRLYVLVRPRLATVRFWELNRDYFVGMFFNSFLVTATGGDVVRAVYLSRYGLPLADAASAVLVERILGMVVLVSVPMLGTILGGGQLPANVAGAFFVASAAIVAGALLLFSPRVDRIILRRLANSSFRPLAKVVEFVRAIHRYRHPTGAFLGAAFWSLPYQLVSIAGVYALGQSLAPQVGIATYFLLFPVVGIISMLPVTINGMGVRESAFVLLFSQAGMSLETASAISLMLLGTIVLQAAVGGLFFVTKRSRTPTVPAELKGSS